MRKGTRAAFAAASLLAPSAVHAQAVPVPAVPELARVSRDLQALSDRVMPAIVQVRTSGYALGEGGFVRERGTGSGVILDASGYVVTNAHVVEGARRVQVALSGISAGPSQARSVVRTPGRVLGAVVVGVDKETDIAVLKVEQAGLPFLPLGESEDVRPGQLVLAFGSPLGLENSVTMGVVSAVARQVKPDDRMIYIQTDAAINPGNSGGPLVDGQGRVVGINTFILSQSGGNEGIGFAAPSNIVRHVYDQIRQTGRVRRGQIGLRGQTITPVLAQALGLGQEWGVVLGDVTPGGPAAKAGLGIGDVVVSMEGKPMENARQLEVNVYRRVPGTRVGLEVLRGTEKRAFWVTVGERAGDPERFADRIDPKRNAIDRLGVMAIDLDDAVAAMLPGLRARAGVVVAAADARAAGTLQPGDVVYAVNVELVKDVAGLRDALARLEPGAPVVLQVEREGGLRYVTVEPE
ncbi:MAG: trypsin-like peptidase domain-containing protein [Vicinamibacteria bacterium]